MFIKIIYYGIGLGIILLNQACSSSDNIGMQNFDSPNQGIANVQTNNVNLNDVTVPVIQLQKNVSLHYNGKEFTIQLIDYQRKNTTITAEFRIVYRSNPNDFSASTMFVFDILLEDGVCYRDADPITEQRFRVTMDSLIKDKTVINDSLNLRSYSPCEPSTWQPEKESRANYIANVLAFDIHKAYQKFLNVCALELKTSGISKLIEEPAMPDTPPISKKAKYDERKDI